MAIIVGNRGLSSGTFSVAKNSTLSLGINGNFIYIKKLTAAEGVRNSDVDGLSLTVFSQTTSIVEGSSLTFDDDFSNAFLNNNSLIDIKISIIYGFGRYNHFFPITTSAELYTLNAVNRLNNTIVFDSSVTGVAISNIMPYSIRLTSTVGNMSAAFMVVGGYEKRIIPDQIANSTISVNWLNPLDDGEGFPSVYRADFSWSVAQ